MIPSNFVKLHNFYLAHKSYLEMGYTEVFGINENTKNNFKVKSFTKGSNSSPKNSGVYIEYGNEKVIVDTISSV